MRALADMFLTILAAGVVALALSVGVAFLNRKRRVAKLAERVWWGQGV